MELEDLFELDSQHIANSIRIIKQKIEEEMPIIRKEINFIIANQEDSIINIERTLDFLLNVIPFGYGENEFKKLNDHYATINKKNSETYTGFYNKLFDN